MCFLCIDRGLMIDSGLIQNKWYAMIWPLSQLSENLVLRSIKMKSKNHHPCKVIRCNTDIWPVAPECHVLTSGTRALISNYYISAGAEPHCRRRGKAAR